MPTKLRLTSTTSSSANVSWESSTTGLGIICELSWYIDGGLVNSTILPSDMMSYRIEGLEANTEYELRINAINTQTNKSSATASITVSTLVAGNYNYYWEGTYICSFSVTIYQLYTYQSWDYLLKNYSNL